MVLVNNSDPTSRNRAPKNPGTYRTPEERRIFRKRGDLTAVRGILQKVLAHRGLADKVSRYEFVMHWEEIVGSAFASVSKPDCVLKNTLVIKVISPGWAQEMGFLKPILLQKIARFMPSGQAVTDVTFRVGPL